MVNYSVDSNDSSGNADGNLLRKLNWFWLYVYNHPITLFYKFNCMEQISMPSEMRFAVFSGVPRAWCWKRKDFTGRSAGLNTDINFSCPIFLQCNIAVLSLLTSFQKFWNVITFFWLKYILRTIYFSTQNKSCHLSLAFVVLKWVLNFFVLYPYSNYCLLNFTM